MGGRTCPHCGRALRTVTRSIGGMAYEVEESCTCEGALADVERRRAAEAEAAKVRAASGAVRRSGMPERFWSVPRDGEGLAALAARGFGLYLYGPVGTGKTYTACGVAKAWVWDHTTTYDGREYVAAPCRYRSVPRLLQEMRECYDGHGDQAELAGSLMRCRLLVLDDMGQESPTESVPRLLQEMRECYDGHGDQAELAGSLMRCRLLVLDDMGQESPTEWALERLWEIVDQRWSNRRPTVVTSQCSPAQLAQRLASRGSLRTAESIVSRLCGAESEVRRIDGPDRRARSDV